MEDRHDWINLKKKKKKLLSPAVTGIGRKMHKEINKVGKRVILSFKKRNSGIKKQKMKMEELVSRLPFPQPS